MKRILWLAVLLSGACSPPTNTPPAASTDATLPTSAPLPTAAEAAGPYADMLAYFPLQVGLQRSYHVSLRYQSGTDAQNQPLIETWEGQVVERITASRQEGDALFFSSEWEGYPERIDPAGPVLITRPMEYRLSGGSLFLERDELLQWPLTPGRSWPMDPSLPGDGSTLYQWTIADKGQVSVPAGTFEGCIEVALWTRPDHTLRTYCPGAGLVRLEYFHHGGGDDIRLWELVEIRRP